MGYGQSWSCNLQDESSMPALPLAHTNVLLMLRITRISANNPRLFTQVEYFSCE